MCAVPLLVSAMECKICLSDGALTGQNRLVDPCRCAGSLRYVHRGCLKRWQEISGNYQFCTVCLTDYVIPEQDDYVPYMPHGAYAIFPTYVLIVIIVFRPKGEEFVKRLLLFGQAMYTIYYAILYAYMLSCIEAQNLWLYLQKARRYAWIPVMHIAAIYGIVYIDIVFCLPAILFPELYLIRHIQIMREIYHWLA